MNISEIDVKMSNCPEIQGSWKPEVGDFTDKGVVVGLGPNLGAYSVYVLPYDKEYNWVDFRLRERIVYVPGQRQLQKMLPSFTLDNDCDPIATWSKICKFSEETFWRWECITKMTVWQLWRAFVMWELHSKQWVDGEWK